MRALFWDVFENVVLRFVAVSLPTRALQSRLAELATLNAREERARELEVDRDALVASYAEMVPEALDSLSGEERSNVHQMLNLEVRPSPEGYVVSGVFCSSTPTGRRR